MLPPKQAPGLIRGWINRNKLFIKEGIVAQQFSETYFVPLYVDLKRQRLRELLENSVNWELVRDACEHNCDETEDRCRIRCGDNADTELEYELCLVRCALERTKCLC